MYSHRVENIGVNKKKILSLKMCSKTIENIYKSKYVLVNRVENIVANGEFAHHFSISQFSYICVIPHVFTNTI